MVLVILLCISLIAGKVDHLPICFFPNSFFLLPVVCSYALSIYLLVGGDRSVFLSYLYDKGEGSSGYLKLWLGVLFTSSIWSFRSRKD